MKSDYRKDRYFGPSPMRWKDDDESPEPDWPPQWLLTLWDWVRLALLLAAIGYVAYQVYEDYQKFPH